MRISRKKWKAIEKIADILIARIFKIADEEIKDIEKMRQEVEEEYQKMAIQTEKTAKELRRVSETAIVMPVEELRKYYIGLQAKSICAKSVEEISKVMISDKKVNF